MSLELFPIETTLPTMGERVRARIALLITWRLARSSPDRIARVISKWATLPPATWEEVTADYNAVCSVSQRCRGQEGCLRRSVAIAAAVRLRGRSVGWSTGFTTRPFQAHAWVQVDGDAVMERHGVRHYQRVIEVTPKASTAEGALGRDAAIADDTDTTDVNPASPTQIVGLLQGQRRPVALVLVLGLVAAALTLALPWYAADLFGRYQQSDLSILSLGLLVLLILAAGAVSAYQTFSLQRIAENVVKSARTGLADHLLDLRIREYDTRNPGDLISRFGSDTATLRGAIVQILLAASPGIALMVGAGIMMMVLDPVLFGTATALMLITLGLTLVASLSLRDAAFAAHKSLGQLSSELECSLVGVRSIRAANATQERVQQLDESVASTYAAAMRVARLQSMISPLSQIGLQISGIVVVAVGAYRAESGSISTADLLRFTVLLLILAAPLTQAISALSQVGESLASLARINEINDLPTEDEHDIRQPHDEPSAAFAKDGPAALEFRNVFFTYRDAVFGERLELDDYVLHGLDLTIPSGKKVAIVGPSGAGKSTLLSLVERFYEPSRGAISIFGRNIRDLARHDLRSQLAYVEQNAPLVTGTIRENLTLGLMGVSDAECLDVLDRLNLSHLVTRNRAGLDASIGELGVKLSGGERQRLATGRALLSSAPIILLDEATASLDSENERSINEILSDLRGDRTVVVVAHRLVSIMDADLICVLEHGRLVDSGTHDYLVDSVPLYRNLAREQLLV